MLICLKLNKKIKMKIEKEIRNEILRIEKDYKHVLDCGPATVDVNSPKALMQLSAISELDILYWFLEETRPKFTCDDRSKVNY